MIFELLVTGVLLGIGLAMDAFSVSVANGINDSKMKNTKMCAIAGTFAAFQFAMPMIGWLCVHTIVGYFSKFEIFIPWIALVLLLFIGGKMLVEGIKGEKEESDGKQLTFATLMVQGIATSIDALSVGFTIADYKFVPALVCGLIIAVVTFVLCIAGVKIGKKFGDIFSSKATVIGGLILIGIGIEIFVKGFVIPLVTG